MENKTLDLFFEKIQNKAVEYYKAAYEKITEFDIEIKKDLTLTRKQAYMKQLNNAIDYVGKGLADDFRRANSFNGLLDREQNCSGGLFHKIQKETSRKRINLINRVSKKVGTITDLKNITIDINGNLNGFVVGTLGTAHIETIGAGGYNIQRYHYRVLVQ